MLFPSDFVIFMLPVPAVEGTTTLISFSVQSIIWWSGNSYQSAPPVSGSRKNICPLTAPKLPLLIFKVDPFPAGNSCGSILIDELLKYFISEISSNILYLLKSRFISFSFEYFIFDLNSGYVSN